MLTSLPSIDLGLPAKLKDKNYRQRFFLAETSANIAKQLIELRKLRHLTQVDLARLAGTGQPAISRVERADYRSWSFKTLRSLAEIMDARIRVLIEPAERVLPEYESLASEKTDYLPATNRIEDLIAKISSGRPHIREREKISILDFDGSTESAANVKSETEQKAPALVGRLVSQEALPKAGIIKKISITKLECDLIGAA